MRLERPAGQRPPPRYRFWRQDGGHLRVVEANSRAWCGASAHDHTAWVTREATAAASKVKVGPGSPGPTHSNPWLPSLPVPEHSFDR